MTTEGWESKVYHAKQRDGKLPANWGTIREKRLIKDNYTCQRCGRRDQLTVHHILPRADGGKNNQGNLITLCSPCHDEVEILGLKSRALIANWGLDSERAEDKRFITESNDWREWVYGGARREMPVIILIADLPKEDTQIKEVIIEWAELRQQVATIKPAAPPLAKAPEVEVIEPPRSKVVKPKKVKRVRQDPIVSFISPDYPVDPGFVAGMYEHYARRNTPFYVREIFERWLMLETTKQWAAKNGRILPTGEIAKVSISGIGNAL